MTHGVLAIFNDPRVQGGEIIVEDVLVGQGLTMSSHGFGPSAEKSIAWIQRCHQIQALGPLLQLGILSLLGLPVALPLFDEYVPALTNTVRSLLRAGVQFVRRGPVQFGVPLVTLGKTFGAPVIETPEYIMLRALKFRRCLKATKD